MTSLEPNSTRNATDPSEVLVSLKWTPPSPRNGPYMLLLNYTAEQTPPYPASRADNNSNSIMLSQNTSQFTIRNVLPFANHTVTVYAVNVKLGFVGVADSTTIRSQPIGKCTLLIFIFPLYLISPILFIFCRTISCD